MSVLNGPGEGTWSVFAMKVTEERDEARYQLQEEKKKVADLEKRLLEAERERDHYKAMTRNGLDRSTLV
jgi:hypothetical protein